jgi:hypothetical protein
VVEVVADAKAAAVAATAVDKAMAAAAESMSVSGGGGECGGGGVEMAGRHAVMRRPSRVARTGAPRWWVVLRFRRQGGARQRQQLWKGGRHAYYTRVRLAHASTTALMAYMWR